MLVISSRYRPKPKNIKPALTVIKDWLASFKKYKPNALDSEFYNKARKLYATAWNTNDYVVLCKLVDLINNRRWTTKYKIEMKSIVTLDGYNPTITIEKVKVRQCTLEKDGHTIFFSQSVVGWSIGDEKYFSTIEAREKYKSLIEDGYKRV